MKNILLCVLSTFLTACVGMSVSTATREHATPRQYFSSSVYCPDVSEVGKLHFCTEELSLSFTPEKVAEIWGKPKFQGVKDGLTYMVYKKDIAWRGIVMLVVIPVPLMAPVGYNYTTLFFENNKLVRTTEEGAKSVFQFVCGLHSTGPDGFGCTTRDGFW